MIIVVSHVLETGVNTMSKDRGNRPETLDLGELAEVLSVSKVSLYRLARQERLPVRPIRVGGQYRFSRRAVDELLAGKQMIHAAGTTAA